MGERELPEPVTAALVRGLGAYIRAAPVAELPASARRLRGFRPQALRPHSKALVQLLDEEGFRAKVAEWLRDTKKPPLSKADVDLLRLATERPEGWADRLDAAAPPEPAVSAPPAPAAVGDAIERERVKVKRARDEARRAKDEARRLGEEATARAVELRRAIEDLEVRLERAEEAARGAASAAEEARRSLERERRKARRDAERATKERDQLEKTLKDWKRRTRELQARLDTLASDAKPPRKLDDAGRDRDAGEPRGAPARRRRRPLAVPKGRFEDDPETLDEWLAAPDVVMVVDGYNVSKAEGGFGELELPDQRDRVVQEVARVARRKSIAAIVVFDGSEVPPGTSRRLRGPVTVEYSRPDESADDHIVALVEGLPPVPVVVVTNDRELQARVAELDATVARSTQLLGLIR